jgi:hypothetical protein
LQLDPARLSSLGADSLLLGGVRPASGGGDVIEVKASQVVVANNKDSALTAPEVLLAATGKVEVRNSGVVKGVGGAPGAGHDYRTAGEGALLLASSQDANFSRTGNPGTSSGELVIGDNAQVTANRSLVLDATKDTDNKGKLAFADKANNAVIGGRLTLGASRISMGKYADDVSGATGLKFIQVDLNGFNKLDSLTLNSYTGFDLYGAPLVGGAGLKALNLNGGGLRGFGGALQTATLQADSVRLSNTAGVKAYEEGGEGSGSGTLIVDARALVLADGDKTLSGFGAVNVNDRDHQRGQRQARRRRQRTLTTARITGQSAQQSLTAREADHGETGAQRALADVPGLARSGRSRRRHHPRGKHRLPRAMSS